jgi:predicted PurR-regulated permease PerM
MVDALDSKSSSARSVRSSRTRGTKARPAARLADLIGGVGLLIAAVRASRGAEFFLPVTAALVVAIALVPMLEWFERRGVPSKLARAVRLIFLLIAIFAIASIVFRRSTGWR